MNRVLAGGQRRVMGYRTEAIGFFSVSGWLHPAIAKPEDPAQNKGHPLVRDRNRRLNVEMVIGGLLVAALLAYIRLYLR